MLIRRKTSDVLRRVLDVVAGDWLSRGYLAVVLALLVWAWADASFFPYDDASLAAVVPALFTAPASLLFVLLPEGTETSYFGLVIAAAMLNAATITLLARTARSA
ncbi:SCO4225 family membrane protein [Streptomyces sp. NBRC 110028]|uniref:SCO4225 family membrane protein n=1 Tax=Streptomyces sp. NBRC 110028 TaxID=1621260 RepID=UPI0007C68BB8|nr:hypothetical protein [Streptomyces sp. NBRC 110028]